jgi:hypothetical protein
MISVHTIYSPNLTLIILQENNVGIFFICALIAFDIIFSLYCATVHFLFRSFDRQFYRILQLEFFIADNNKQKKT